MTCEHGFTEAHADKTVGVRVGGDYPMCPGGLAANLVGVTEIGLRLGVQPNTVSIWRIRHDSFPQPLVGLSMGPVWYWPDVQAWAEARET